MRGPSAFAVPDRELIAAYVSALNACRFCVGVHGAVAERFGVDPGLLELLAEDVDAAPIREELRPVLRYVRKLNAEPSQIIAADADAILAAGWPERAVHDAASICGLFNLFNRLVDGVGIVGDSEFFSAAAMMLTEPAAYGAVVAADDGSQSRAEETARD
jgi:uncharacterized peroxidase-related enzyme